MTTEEKIARDYCNDDLHLTPISNTLHCNWAPSKQAYLSKMCDIVGWKHKHNISVPDTSLYKTWEYLGALLGRKQDYTAVIGWGYRSALWGGEFEDYPYVIINNLRGTAFEVDPKIEWKSVKRFVGFIEETLLNQEPLLKK